MIWHWHESFSTWILSLGNTACIQNPIFIKQVLWECCHVKHTCNTLYAMLWAWSGFQSSRTSANSRLNLHPIFKAALGFEKCFWTRKTKTSVNVKFQISTECLLNCQTLKAPCQGEHYSQYTLFAKKRDLTTNRESAASINIHREWFLTSRWLVLTKGHLPV